MEIIDIAELYNLYIQTSGVCTDTRDIKESSMFFALKGENFDGNLFAQDALAKGAKYAVLDNKDLCVWEHYQEKSTELCGDAQQLSVLG